jgi:uncharacterized protein (DUF433 family)
MTGMARSETSRIVRDEDVMGGKPVTEDTRITVLRVHALVTERGLPPEEVAAMHDLDEADVSAALQYYEDNPEGVAEVREWREEMESEARAAGAKTVAEIREERDGVSGTR